MQSVFLIFPINLKIKFNTKKYNLLLQNLFHIAYIPQDSRIIRKTKSVSLFSSAANVWNSYHFSIPNVIPLSVE